MNINIYLKIFIHELRTPISTISMGLDILENNNHENNIVIEDIRESITFIENIFSKFAVIKDGNIKLNTYEPFALSELINNSIELLHYNIDQNKVDLKYYIEPSVHDWNYGDKYNIKHCIINLLKNAIKYKNITRNLIISITITRLENINIESLFNINIKSRNIKLIPTKSVKLKSIYKPQPPNSQKSSKLLGKKINTNIQYISITICDNNDYILPNIKEHLFESFNSTSGSGLGLYICKNIIELHGGNIYHNFINICGNKFTIILPLEICSEKKIQISEYNTKRIKKNYSSISNHKNSSESILENDNESILVNDTKSILENDNKSILEMNTKNDLENDNKNVEYNILIIDDSILNRKMLQKMFSMTQFYNKIYEIGDGNLVLYKLYQTNDEKDTFYNSLNQTFNVNIIFLDKNMPLTNGDIVAKELRNNNYNELIIGLTGEDNLIEIEKFIDHGANYVLVKPFNTHKLNLVTNFIKKYGTKQRLNKKIELINNSLEWI